MQKIRAEIDAESDILSDLTPRMEEIRKAIRALESKIDEAGGAEYKLRKDELERMVSKCQEVEKQITRMRTNLSNTEMNMLRHDKEIEKEQKEIVKLEEANRKLKDEVEKNTQHGEKLLAEMAAIDEEKKRNREELD